MIRRRTYLRGEIGNYGYFMRNLTYYVAYIANQQGYSNVTTQRQYIYSKCMQEESPVGEFPISYRESASDTIGGIQSAVGCTNGSVIIVATGGRLFKSVNNGTTWSQLATITRYTYNNQLFNPIVWMDSNYYYYLYSTRNQQTYAGSTCTLRLFKYTINSGTTTDTVIRTDSVGSSGSLVNDVQSNVSGVFYNYAVSPQGQICFTRVYEKAASTSYRRYIVFDFKTGKYSGDISITKTTDQENIYESVGQWVNTNGGYGKFLIQVTESYQVPGNGGKYWITPSSITTNGQSLGTPNAVSSSLPNIDYTQSIIFITGTCRQQYNNKLFVYAARSDDSGTFYVTDATFGSPQKICSWDSNMSALFDNEYKWPSGLIITPDGKYGCFLGNRGNIVFDVNTLAFRGGVDLSVMEGINNSAIRAVYSGYMLPATTV